MKHMEGKKDVLKSLESLMERVENGDVEILSCHKAALQEVIKDYHINNTPMTAYFSLEDWLYKDDKPIEAKSAIIWGGLWVVRQIGCITWDEMRGLYGEFMSKQMNLR